MRIQTLTIVVLFCSNLFASPKPNILFQGLKGKSRTETLFIGSLESRIRSAIVNSKRINVITRDSIFWTNLRSELEIKDFISSETALKLGELSGASHYLEGVLLRYQTENRIIKTQEGVNKTEYNSFAEISISLIDLESGKYMSSFTVQKSVWANDQESAMTSCFTELSDEISDRFKKLFPITTSIINLRSEARELEIDKGESDGVTPQSNFLLAGDNNSIVRITKVSNSSAHARILAGQNQNFKIGSVLIESFSAAKSTVRIAKIQEGRVYVDAGQNLDLKKGDLLVLRKISLITNDNDVLHSESIPAAVIVTDVKEEFATVNPILGFAEIKEGIELEASKDKSITRQRFVFGGFKYGFIGSIKPNTSQGIVSVSNSLGEFQIPTTYHTNNKDINSVGIVSLGFGTHNLIKRISTSLNIDVYNIGNGKLGTWVGHLDCVYEDMIKENSLYFFYGGGLGYGGLRQKIPNNVIQTISSGNANESSSSSIFATAKIGLRWMYHRLGFSLTGSYDYLQFKKWDYAIENSKTEEMPSALLPYPVVNLSGIYLTGSVVLKFKN